MIGMSFEKTVSYITDATIKNRACISKRPIQEEVLLALENGEVPRRYRCNAHLLTIADQGRLALSRVILVGCGGFTEQVLELLVLLGVGKVVIYDPEGRPGGGGGEGIRSGFVENEALKVEMMCSNASKINPLVSIQPVVGRLHQAILQDARVVVDCLTDHSLRGVLQKMASNVKTPLVSAAVSEWTILATTTWQDKTGLKDFMSNDFEKKKCENAPAFLNYFAASIQVMEVLRILTDASSALNGNILRANLSQFHFSTISLHTTFDY